jgi:hypothetical protein
MMRFIQNCCFFFLIFFVFSTYQAFAYTGLHHQTGHAHHVFYHFANQSYHAADAAYDDTLLNDEDDHEGVDISYIASETTTNHQDFIPEQVDDLPYFILARQVHRDYLLDEDTAEKTTTSQ